MTETGSKFDKFGVKIWSKFGSETGQNLGPKKCPETGQKSGPKRGQNLAQNGVKIWVQKSVPKRVKKVVQNGVKIWSKTGSKFGSKKVSRNGSKKWSKTGSKFGPKRGQNLGQNLGQKSGPKWGPGGGIREGGFRSPKKWVSGPPKRGPNLVHFVGKFGSRYPKRAFKTASGYRFFRPENPLFWVFSVFSGTPNKPYAFLGFLGSPRVFQFFHFLGSPRVFQKP